MMLRNFVPIVFCLYSYNNSFNLTKEEIFEEKISIPAGGFELGMSDPKGPYIQSARSPWQFINICIQFVKCTT